MRKEIDSLQRKIAFGMITIREDEAKALLARFKVPDSAYGRARYDIGVLTTLEGTEHQFALVRCTGTGQGEAQRVAHALIEDLHPRLILLVGIGGAVPSKDFTLGDVVCAIRVHDFCVVAKLDNRPDELDLRGGPMHRRVEDILRALPVILERDSMKGWNFRDGIRCKLPHLVVPPDGSDRYYGSDDWKKSVRESLEYHFPEGKQPRRPLVTAQSVASSDALVKDTKTAKQWRKAARAFAAIEMELAGVYLAARSADTEVPILAVRGISDIVGFKRGEEWTKFACHSAAAFAFALVKSGELDPLLLQPAGPMQAAKPPKNSPDSKEENPSKDELIEADPSYDKRVIDRLDDALLRFLPSLLPMGEEHRESGMQELLGKLLTLSVEAFAGTIISASLLLLDERKEYLEIVKRYGWYDESKDRRRFNIGFSYLDMPRGIAGEAFIKRKITIAHIMKDEYPWKSDNNEYLKFRDDSSFPPYRSMVAVPIFDSNYNATLGVFCFDSVDRTVFDPPVAQELLIQISQRLSLALSIYPSYQAGRADTRYDD